MAAYFRSSSPTSNTASNHGLLQEVSAQTILSTIKKSDAKLTLVNIWASWCGPCRAEFPDLLKIRGAYQSHGLNLVLISADNESERGDALHFLNQQKVDFVSYIKGDQGFDFITTLYPRWNGAVPSSLLFDSQGRLLKAWEGASTYENFSNEVQKYLPKEASHATGA